MGYEKNMSLGDAMAECLKLSDDYLAQMIKLAKSVTKRQNLALLLAYVANCEENKTLDFDKNGNVLVAGPTIRARLQLIGMAAVMEKMYFVARSPTSDRPQE